jgi:hypothetical protein
MPINKNHEFEDLEGVKCSIVEKNASAERVNFLKSLLVYNGFKIMVVASPPPKIVAAPKPLVAASAVILNAEVSATEIDPALTPIAPLPSPPSPPAPETFTVGVTDVMFNPTNAVFGRLLHTTDGHVVTLAYWEQKETEAQDEVPYFENIK